MRVKTLIWVAGRCQETGVTMIRSNMNLYILMISLLLLSCNKSEVDSVRLYEDLLRVKVDDGIRIFDFSVVQATPVEKTYWIAFDANNGSWNTLVSALKLKVYSEKGEAFGLGSGRSDMETGFEGYLDDDYQTFYTPDDDYGFFHVRKVGEYYRVVYLLRES